MRGSCYHAPWGMFMLIRRATLWLVLCLVILLSAGAFIFGLLRPLTEKPKMGLEVSLFLERTELIIGESTPVTLVFTNATDAPLAMLDPQRSLDWPKIRVRDLTRGTERSYGPHDLEKKRVDEFVEPEPPTNISLPPHQPLRTTNDLLRWIELPTPGDYELTASMTWAGGEAASKPFRVSVQPLKLRSAYFVGSDSGHTPFRYCVWSQARGADSVVLISLVTFDHHGHPELSLSRRLAEVPGDARPVASVSPRNLPYPAHWIVWTKGDFLFGFYEMNGQAKTSVNAGALNLTGASPLGPVMLDLKGSDGSRPGRGHVLIWQPGAGATTTLPVRTFEPDGSLSAGQPFIMDAGELRWGRGAMLANGEQRYVLAVQRGDAATLELLRRSPTPPASPAAVPFAELKGQLLGGGMMLNREDAIFGAVLLRDKPDGGGRATSYTLQTWRVEANAAAHAGQPLPVRCDEKLEQARSIVEVSPQGRAVALLQAANRKWYASIDGSPCLALPSSLARFGEPVSAFWLNEAQPFLVMAGEQTGITYQPLPTPAQRADE